MQDQELIISVVIGSFGAIVGLYGALQSWLTKRRTKQLELELLVSKLDIDLDYTIETIDSRKILRGKVFFKNLGNTNLRITELDIKADDRAKDLQTDQHAINLNSFINNHTLKTVLGVSNSHLVTHSLKEKTFRLQQTDTIFVQREGRVRKLNVKNNIMAYIERSLNAIKEIFSKPDANNNFYEFFFKRTLGSDIRGFEIFPGGEKTQEFLIDYDGRGVLYLNVETTALRMFKADINVYEELKLWGDRVQGINGLNQKLEEEFTNFAKKLLKPASEEFHREKETFLILLA